MIRFFLLAAILSFPSRGEALEQTPRIFVSQMANEVLIVLQQPDISADAKINQIETITDKRFHFPTIARLVAARNWRKLSKTQQSAFRREFQKHLSVTYGRNVSRFDNQTTAITGDRAEPRGDWTVQTVILDPSGEDLLVDYRLRKIQNRWQVIDVVVERISLVANFRAQVQELFTKRGVTATLAFLQEKNAKGQSILPDDKATPGR